MEIITEEMEEEFTVDEMIGVMKYLMMQHARMCNDYYHRLLDFREQGYGEVTVASCYEVGL